MKPAAFLKHEKEMSGSEADPRQLLAAGIGTLVRYGEFDGAQFLKLGRAETPLYETQ